MFLACVLVSLLYTAIVAVVPFVSGLDLREAGHWGDWIAGAALPLAIAWAIAGFFKQSEELKLQAAELHSQRKQLEEQLQEMKATRVVIQRQTEIQADLVAEASKQNAFYAFQEVQQWVATFQPHLENLARDFITSLDPNTKELGEDNQPYHYILELTRRLNSLDWLHGTAEVQKKIQAIRADQRYEEFFKGFLEFLEKTGKYRWLRPREMVELDSAVATFSKNSATTIIERRKPPAGSTTA